MAELQKNTNRISKMEVLEKFIREISEPYRSRGLTYFQKGAVRPLGMNDDAMYFNVTGTDIYEVHGAYFKKGPSLSLKMTCDCPSPKPCKHIAACAYHALYEHTKGDKYAKVEKPYFRLIVNEKKQAISIQPSKNNSQEMGMLLNLSDVSEHLGNELDIWYFYGPQFMDINYRHHAIKMLKRLPADMMEIYDKSGHALKLKGFVKPEIHAEPATGKSAPHRYENSKFMQPDSLNIRALWRHPEDGELHDFKTGFFYIEKIIGEGLFLNVLDIDDPEIFNLLYRPDRDSYDRLMKLRDKNNGYSYVIGENLQLPFLYGPHLEVSVRSDPSITDEPVLIADVTVLYYRDPPEKFHAMTENFYGISEILPESYRNLREFLPDREDFTAARFPFHEPTPYFLSMNPVFYGMDDKGIIAKRLIDKEAALHILWREKKIPKSGNRRITSKKFRSFFLNEIPAMLDAGAAVYMEKDLLDLAEAKSRSVFFNIGPSSGTDWFEGAVHIDGLTKEETALAIEAQRQGREFIRNQSGKWINIGNLELKSILQTVREQGLSISKDGSVSQISAASLAALYHEIDIRTENHKNKVLDKIKLLTENRSIAFTLPQGFKAKLRSYQKNGTKFLLERHFAGTGAILADDMGLGKTVQTLAFMAHLAEHSGKRKKTLFLVVCPTAALGVWSQEAERFCPGLNFQVWHGSERRDTKPISEGAIVTSFGILTRDAEVFRKLKITSIIVDEAQFVKNHLSVNARSLRSLSPGSIICLTGTPLENHATELWALLDLIFPGYAGTRKSFQAKYRNPSDEAIEILRKKIKPILLRRRREEVLKDLPELTRQDIILPMNQKQAAAYESLRLEAREVLANAGPAYLMIMLPYLMKLRRIACHPGLESRQKSRHAEDSGKFSFFLEQREEIESSSSGILVFSQFTDVLDILQSILEKEKTDFFRIDGSTPAGKRSEFVKKFQNGEGKYFLLSLKAGGSALTLHRADTVIHLDPWWNPAAEEQATARAHRMGQRRHVFVYRYISAGTVEEKVIALQDKKRKLFRDILDHPESSASKSITREEIMELLE